MLIKLLDRSDIIRYGKTVIDLPNHVAENLIKAKRAMVFVGNMDQNKAFAAPPKDKMVWTSPEKKALKDFGNESEIKKPYPGTNDPLFPEHIIGRN